MSMPNIQKLNIFPSTLGTMPLRACASCVVCDSTSHTTLSLSKGRLPAWGKAYHTALSLAVASHSAGIGPKENNAVKNSFILPI